MKTTLILGIVCLLLISSTWALSLSGKSLNPITYVPDTIITNHYTIGGTDRPFTIQIDNATFKHISIERNNDYEFDLILNFPSEEYIAPGSYNLGLTVSEIEGTSGSISTKVSVSKSFTVNVYSYDKDINLIFNTPNISQGEDEPVQLTVQSMGYPDIDQVYGEITVYDSSQQLVTSVQTEKKSLAGLQSMTFSPSLNTQHWLPNTYSAIATVWYDQKSKTDNASFMIGQQDIALLNYTRELHPGFSEFSILLRNNWGRELQNVYAILSLNGSELLQTPSITLPPWSLGTLKGIAQVNLPPAQYPGKITLHFDDKAKEISVPITVIPLEEKPSSSLSLRNSLIWGSLFALAIIIAIAIIYFSQRKK